MGEVCIRGVVTAILTILVTAPFSALIQAMVHAAGPSQSAPLPARASQPGAVILSDTMGVDFAPYMRRQHDDISRVALPDELSRFMQPIFPVGRIVNRIATAPFDF